MVMQAYACWTGYPYTLESSVSIRPSGKYSYTETQKRNSNYYVRLVGNKACNGSASVSIK